MKVLPSLSFGTPWVLVLLPLLLLLPRRFAWTGRILTLGLLVVALAQPYLLQPSPHVAVLIDVSDSVGTQGVSVAADFDFSALPEPPSFFLFGADATAVDTPTGTVPPFLPTDRTDIARALQVAHASGARRVLLLSDGAQSVGDARTALPDFPVDTFRLEPMPNVRLVDLLAPEHVTPNEPFEVIAVIESDRDAQLELFPYTDDRSLAPVPVSLPAGRTPVRFSIPAGTRDTQIGARLEVDFEQPWVDDQMELVVAVMDEPPVLVIGDPAFTTLLETQGFDVVSGGPELVGAPLQYSAIILRTDARQFTPGQLTLLEEYVRNGGGLMMTGGPDSFGLGGWYRTPVEEVLPVHTDVRTEIDLPLVAMILILDRSQSMTAGRPQRIELARQGAIDVVELAYEQDQLGLVVFDSQHEWVFPLQRATEENKQEMLRAILTIMPQGGTIIKSAYTDALEALRASEAAFKHVIVLSDGEFFDGRGPFGGSDVPDFGALARQGFRDGITTSTIAIGEADYRQMEALASGGGGRFYAVQDPSMLPQVFTTEALAASRALLRDDALAPQIRTHPLTQGVSRNPPMLDAYVASSLKPGSEMLLEGARREPVLAVGRQGLGRSAAFTTDLNTWAGSLGTWDELPAMLGAVVRWLQTRPAEYAANVTQEGTALKVVVDAVQDGRYINDQELEIRYGNIRTSLDQVAPGRYEGRMSTPAESGYLLVVNDGQVVARSQVIAPNAEFETRGSATLMRELSQQTGGLLFEVPGSYNPPTPTARTAVWSYFAIAGLLLFMLELVVRRLMNPRTARG